jgi:hypothetical protein
VRRNERFGGASTILYICRGGRRELSAHSHGLDELWPNSQVKGGPTRKSGPTNRGKVKLK